MPTQTIIKYGDTDITWEFQSGRWHHPETGVQYTAGWNPLDVEGLTVESVDLPDPPAPEPYVPTLTPRQIRLVLNAAGLRAQVEAAIAASDPDTKDYWEFSLTYEHTHPRLVALASQLGLTNEQVAQMFIDGAGL